MPAAPAIKVGFRVHSGWAAMVAVSGSPSQPLILDRRRIDFADLSRMGSVQPYHMARDLGVDRGSLFIEQCRAASNTMAHAALESAIKNIGGDRIRRCAILTGSGRSSASLAATLASHAAIHTAEGEFFREVLRGAAESCQLRVRQIKEKELLAEAAAQFQTPIMELQHNLNDLSKHLGPPWRQDQKLAALAAWLA